MRKNHIVIGIIFAIIILSLAIPLKINIQSDVLIGFLTVLSILFAFIITGITSLFGKNILKKLRSIEEKKAFNQQTQLMTLKKYFNNIVITIFCALVLNILLLLIIFDNGKIIECWVRIILQSLYLVLLFESIYGIALLSKILLETLMYEDENKE